MKRLALFLGLALVVGARDAEASSCADANACVCQGSDGAIMDVEVVSVDGPRTTVRVDAVINGGKLSVGATFQLARASVDEVGQRLFLYFDAQRSLQQAIRVADGSVSCPQPGGQSFALPADDAFRMASNPETCFQAMMDAGMPGPPPCGVRIGPGPGPGGSCSASPGWLGGLFILLWTPLVRRGARRPHRAAA